MLDVLRLNPLVDRVVDSVHASFPSHHSREDTKSALWVWILENKNTVGDLVRYNDKWQVNLYHLMTKAANEHLKKEDQAIYGYSAQDAFNYPRDLVIELLQSAFNYTDWQSFGYRGDGQPRSKGLANQTGDRVAMYADVKAAVEKIPAEQKRILLRAFRDQWSAEGIAEEVGISPEAAKKRISRAVGAVQRRLGGKPYSDLRQGFDGRRVPSGNRDSIAQTEREYEG